MVIKFDDDNRQAMEFKDNPQGKFIRLSILGETPSRYMHLLNLFEDRPSSPAWLRAQYIDRTNKQKEMREIYEEELKKVPSTSRGYACHLIHLIGSRIFDSELKDEKIGFLTHVSRHDIQPILPPYIRIEYSDAYHTILKLNDDDENVNMFIYYLRRLSIAFMPIPWNTRLGHPLIFRHEKG